MEETYKQWLNSYESKLKVLQLSCRRNGITRHFVVTKEGLKVITHRFWHWFAVITDRESKILKVMAQMPIQKWTAADIVLRDDDLCHYPSPESALEFTLWMLNRMKQKGYIEEVN